MDREPGGGTQPAADKLLLTPEERPPEILVRANALAVRRAQAADPRGAIERLFADPALLAAHRAMLPGGGRASAARSTPRCDRRSPSWTIARGSLRSTNCSPPRKDGGAVDTRGLDRLARLKRGQPGLKNVK